MGSKTFLSITQEECRSAYKELLANSDAKWESAKQIAVSGDYGTATALAIISTEELIKSLIVVMDGYGFRLRKVKGMATVFRNHKVRYIIAYAMFIVNVFGEDLAKFMISLRSNPAMVQDLVRRIREKDPDLTRKLKIYAIAKFKQVKAEFEWFSRVDVFRQESLYCDYNEQLKNPITINVEHYNQVVVRLERVRKVGKILIESINLTEEVYVNHFTFMRNIFVQDKYYNRMSSALRLLNETKENPFDLVKKWCAENLN